MDKQDFIGVFDSGVGGVSVLKSLVAELPHEDFVYFGDTAHNPYGQKTTEEIWQLSEGIVGNLIDKGAKAIVVACNTATSVSATRLREKFPTIPIIGIEPAVKPACQAKPGSRILVMATPVTLRLEKFKKLVDSCAGTCEVVLLPCPGLASRIEKGHLDDPDLIELLESLSASVREKCQAEDGKPAFDSVVLGCTHYPFITKQIRQVLGDVELFDGANGTARRLRQLLVDKDLLSDSDKPGTIDFESSSTDPETIELYRSFFKRPIML